MHFIRVTEQKWLKTNILPLIFSNSNERYRSSPDPSFSIYVSCDAYSSVKTCCPGYADQPYHHRHHYRHPVRGPKRPRSAR